VGITNAGRNPSPQRGENSTPGGNVSFPALTGRGRPRRLDEPLLAQVPVPQPREARQVLQHPGPRQLKGLTAEAPRRQEALLDHRRAEADRIIALHRANGSEAAVAAFRAGQGKRKDLGRLLDKVKDGQKQPPEYPYERTRLQDWRLANQEAAKRKPLGDDAADPVKQAEDALKALREARDPETQRRAADALERALQKFRGQRKPAGRQNTQ
jgi:hypothetical protein